MGPPSTCRSCDIARWSAGLVRRGWPRALISIATPKTRLTSCDVLSSFSSPNKPSLHELCRVMGLPGKPDDIGGADVERYCREGRIAEVAAYCETDVVNTYRVWLRYELFRGRLTGSGLRASEANLSGYIRSHSDAKPHLAYVLVEETRGVLGPDCRSGFNPRVKVKYSYRMSPTFERYPSKRAWG